jgi:general secretion pathway protein I
MRRHGDAGFTLLEVLVAMVILSVAIVTLIQLASQGLRLLRVSGEHQEAVMLADRLARAADVSRESVDTGHEGPFDWERRTRLVVVPADLTPAGPVGADTPRLLSLSVTVKWAGGRSVEVATQRLAQGTGTTP